MKIQQLQELKIFDRRKKDLIIVCLKRNAFDRKSSEAFIIEKRTQDGKLISTEDISEEFAQILLDQALISLPKQDVEITKLSTGTVFNYPRKFV